MRMKFLFQDTGLIKQEGYSMKHILSIAILKIYTALVKKVIRYPYYLFIALIALLKSYLDMEMSEKTRSPERIEIQYSSVTASEIYIYFEEGNLKITGLETVTVKHNGYALERLADSQENIYVMKG